MPADGPLPQNPTAAPADPDPRTARPSWSDRYGARHRMCRVKDFPPGLVGPRKVRIYWRNDHYLLQWWAPAQGKNVSERIVGDLLTALVRAREVEQRLTDFPRASTPAGRTPHATLVQRFLDHLRRRAEAGEIQPATVERYRTALGHYLAFVSQDSVRKAHGHAHQIDRDFRL